MFYEIYYCFTLYTSVKGMYIVYKDINHYLSVNNIIYNKYNDYYYRDKQLESQIIVLPE